MIAEKNIISKPTTLSEFKGWEPEDGYKYEWNDGELIQLTGMNKYQGYIFGILNKLMFKLGFGDNGTLISEYDVWLTGIQMTEKM